MEKVIEFLKENTLVFLATVDNGKPRVRPFQFLFGEEGRLYFCTANTKAVYRQLRENPQVEFTVTSPDYVTLRVQGNATFCNDINRKARVLSENPMIKGIYKTPDNPVFEIFYLDNGMATISKLTGEPSKQVSF